MILRTNSDAYAIARELREELDSGAQLRINGDEVVVRYGSQHAIHGYGTGSLSYETGARRRGATSTWTRWIKAGETFQLEISRPEQAGFDAGSAAINDRIRRAAR